MILISLNFFFYTMLTKTRQLQNIAKVIGLCRVKKYIQPSIGLLERSVFAWPEETRLVCASYS